jgi:hypothetical protein
VAPCPIIQHHKTAIVNIKIGIKRNFIQKEWLFSGQLAVETNTVTFDKSLGIRTGYDAYTFTIGRKKFWKNPCTVTYWRKF